LTVHTTALVLSMHVIYSRTSLGEAMLRGGCEPACAAG
jgi:hypothetical protein